MSNYCKHCRRIILAKYKVDKYERPKLCIDCAARVEKQYWEARGHSTTKRIIKPMSHF